MTALSSSPVLLRPEAGTGCALGTHVSEELLLLPASRAGKNVPLTPARVSLCINALSGAEASLTGFPWADKV